MSWEVFVSKNMNRHAQRIKIPWENGASVAAATVSCWHCPPKNYQWHSGKYQDRPPHAVCSFNRAKMHLEPQREFWPLVRPLMILGGGPNLLGACRNSPKCTYIFLGAFRQKPKSHLKQWCPSD
jgi:hypothetical protein